MSDITIVGGTENPTDPTKRPADVAAAERRKLVQSCFIETDPELTKRLMLVHDVKAREMHEAMDYRIDATAWMRDNGFPDGFQGLKVWPESEVDKYYAWHAALGGVNALGLPSVRPSFSQVQAVMDREFAAHAINPAHPIPWH